MDATQSHCNRLLVAAFDFGTTYSGYAFSFRDKPLDIKTNQSWTAGSQQLMSLKTPTCVLLKPNKEFHSFGFEAENKYSDLAEDDAHHGWYLFRRFKMILYDTKELNLDVQIEDISGKKMPALTIFGHAFRYLNNHFLKTLCSQTVGVSQCDVQYVITVPAIWDQKAKQFMHRAANEGGIPDDQLKIALEPEAASIWCQVATDHKLSGLENKGSKYMVVDLGGGTADITVHEKIGNASLKEISKASGGSWGGVQIDNAYVQLLTELVGRDAMEKFIRDNTGDFFDMLRDFETKKRTISIETDGKMTFKLPLSLKEYAEAKGMSMNTLIERSPYRGKMSWVGDKIRIEKAVAKGLFDKTIAEIIRHVGNIFSEPKLTDVSSILLVGGFGECELVRDAFEKKFTNKKLFVPPDPGLAVLKGAVRFGHLSDIISLRVARCSYGWEIWPDFNESLHDHSKRKNVLGKNVCTEVFHKVVNVGEEIPLEKEVSTICSVVSGTQTQGSIRVFSSNTANPQYVTDIGCLLLGTINFDLPTETNDPADKSNQVFFKFGDTELKVRVVILKTNRAFETKIDCFN